MPKVLNVSYPRRKWLILATTFYLNLVVDGYCCIFGILAIHIQASYPDTHPAVVALIGAIAPTLYNLMAPLGLALVELCGSRDVTIAGSLASAIGFMLCWTNGTFFAANFWIDFLTAGLLEGVAFALLYGPSINTIPTFFDHHTKSFAIGVTTCGSAVGAIFFGFVAEDIIEALGWRGTMLLFAMFSLQGVVAAFSFPSRGELLAIGVQDELFPDSALSVPPHFSMQEVFRNYFDMSHFSNCSFLLVLSAAAFSTAGFLVPIYLIPAHTTLPQFGVSLLIQTKIIFIWGCANLCGRLVSGRLGDYGRTHERLSIFSSYWIYIGGVLICSVALLVFPHVMFYGDLAFIGAAVVCGFFIAPMITMRSVLVTDLFGKRNSASCFGWFLATQGICQVFGYALPAFLNTIDIVWAYLFAAVCLFGAATCVGATGALFFKQRQKHFENLRTKKKMLSEILK